MSEAREFPAGIKERDCYLVYRARAPNTLYRPAELAKLMGETKETMTIEGFSVKGRPAAVLPEVAPGAAAAASRRGRAE
jgi:hypothetical protein